MMLVYTHLVRNKTRKKGNSEKQTRRCTHVSHEVKCCLHPMTKSEITCCLHPMMKSKNKRGDHKPKKNVDYVATALARLHLHACTQGKQGGPRAKKHFIVHSSRSSSTSTIKCSSFCTHPHTHPSTHLLSFRPRPERRRRPPWRPALAQCSGFHPWPPNATESGRKQRKRASSDTHQQTDRKRTSSQRHRKQQQQAAASIDIAPANVVHRLRTNDGLSRMIISSNKQAAVIILM